MSFHPFLRRSRRRGQARRAVQGHSTRRLRFETFEDRCLLSLTPAVGYGVGLAPQGVVAADFNNEDDHETANARRVTPLSGLARDGVAHVVDVAADADDAVRLKSLGFCIGRRVQLVKAGDPLVVRVLGARVGLSARLAECVSVAPVS